MDAYGATRITDTTRLDRIGIPVFAAIRPRAGLGSVSVTSGKSPDRDTAKVGALAEAYELACARYLPSICSTSTISLRSFAKQCGYRVSSLPVLAQQLNSLRSSTEHIQLACVQCRILGSAEGGLLPASLVFFPRTTHLGTDYFGASTNGLASGNSFEEAVLHAMLETIERDVISFLSAGRPAEVVLEINDLDFLSLERAVTSAGLQLEILHCSNEFALPTFAAYLFDEINRTGPVFVGYGTHLSKSIAIMRACTEAIQSRLTHIHGARDDILGYFDRWSALNSQQKMDRINKIRSSHAEMIHVRYDAIPDVIEQENLQLAIDCVRNRLTRNGLDKVCVFEYQRLIDEICVVRVVVPGLEFYTPERQRVGERLLNYVRTHKT